ncbi:MAG: menaquinone biosynthesis protein [Candidatus Rokubacteria bacterium]|nr:menaquinone biosynthesis protein [Candidatus Rokubacteria bacterium]
MIRVGRIPYLNCEPFYHALDHPTVLDLPPRAMGEAARRGEIDAAPLSVVDGWALAEAFGPLPFGIAVRRAARSVLLFSRRPLTRLDGAAIAVTPETSTSVLLLRVLLALRYGVAPRAWVGPEEEADARLLIGDGALQARGRLEATYPHRIDLALEWHAWTGLPFVFARWVVRRGCPPEEVQTLAQALGVALDRGMAALDEIGARRRELGLTPGEVAEYLRGFAYRLGPDEEKAEAEFRRCLEKLEA